MSDPFVHLHVHGEYSTLDGYGHPSQFVERAVELGQTALAVTDHGSVSAHKRHYDECVKAGIKPILGVEAYVCDDITSKTQRSPWHITLLAKNLTGYRNLLKLVSHSWEFGFYYKPRVDWSLLQQYKEGIIATSGCPGGKVGKGISKEGWTQTKVVAELKRQAAIFDDYFVEVSPWNYDDGIKIATEVYGAAVKEGMPMVLTMDAHYPRPEHAHIQDVMLCINNSAKFNDPKRMKFDQQDYCLWSGNDMAAKWSKIHGSRLPGLDSMLENTTRIAEMVDFKFPSTSLVEFPYDGDKKWLLRQLCEKGMQSHGFTNRPGYRERLEYEFALVLDKKFVDYFLIVQDLIVWAKDNGVLVGPARGSSCGSLMCYLLRITEIDPLEHGLMFERFIDVSRSDMPDIDIDFEAERREEVKRYMAEKYGQDRVATLATFSTFKGKMCLQDIGRVFDIPDNAVDECKRLIVQRSSADSRAGFTIEDTFANFEQAANWLKQYPELGLAKQLEGQIRQLGVHAAGVVLSNEPISNFAATYVTKNDERVISMDYHDATSVGLMKIDILGLTSLTAVKNTLAFIEQNHGKKIDLLKVPLDDAAVYKNFCDGKLWGVFQFEGAATRQVCKQVAPDNFKQLVAVNALSRPGPLHSQGTSNYIERRWGKQEAPPLHPMLEEITSFTYGITVYQEQVMQVVRKMGKFDWSETAFIRKAMSKKYGNEAFDRMRKKFVAGAESQGVTEEDALKVWHNIMTFGSWAFNLSHSVAYSVMAYQIMWLKTHYPAEFYAGFMGVESDLEKQQRLLREYAASFGRPLHVCVNNSGLVAKAEKGGLRLGLTSIVGMGDKVCQAVIDGQPYKNYIDFNRRCKIPETKKDVLLRIGAFRDLEFEYVSEQADIFGNDRADKLEFNHKEPAETDLRRWCPIMAENKECQRYRVWVGKLTKSKCYQNNEIDSITEKQDVLVVGKTDPATMFNPKNRMEEQQSRGNVFKAKPGEEYLTKEQYNFLNFNLNDETDSLIVRVSYKIYPKFQKELWAISPDDTIGVRGFVLGEMRMVFAHNVVNLTKLRAKLEQKQPLTALEQDFIRPNKKARNNLLFKTVKSTI